MDLVIALGIITCLYLGALCVNRLMDKIDEHEDIINSDDSEIRVKNTSFNENK